MLYKIYISREASLVYVHAMQIFPVHIGVCSLPTHQLLLFPYSRFWSKRTEVKKVLNVNKCLELLAWNCNKCLELLYFVKYDLLTEYLTLFSWYALPINQCFDSKEFERCEIWTMFTSACGSPLL